MLDFLEYFLVLLTKLRKYFCHLPDYLYFCPVIIKNIIQIM